MDIDPTKPGKYPVVLSDALLGKDTAAGNHVYTGVRYNTRVRQESATTAKLKPDAQKPGAGITYDLSFLDDAGRYSFQGTRRVGDAQMVLIFDAQHEHFVLHQLDSTFDLNLTRTPDNDSPDALRQRHPHLNRVRNSARAYVPPKPKKKQPPAPAPKKPAAAPAAAKPSPAARNAANEDSDEDDDDDFGLTIENPDGVSSQKSQPMRDFSPAFGTRRFSEFVEQQQQDDDDDDALGEPDDDGLQVEDPDADADAEEDDDDSDDASVEHFKLPSPMARQMEATATSSVPPTNGHSAAQDDDDEELVSEEDADDDDVPMQDVAPAEAADGDDDAASDDGLEAELMAALGEQESDVSEEE